MVRSRSKELYTVYGVDAKTGARRRLGVDRLIIELRSGVGVEIELAPHPRFAGELVMLCPPREQMAQRHEEGNVDSFAVLFGAANVLHVKVETRARSSRGTETGPKAPKVARARTPLDKRVAKQGARIKS